MELDIEKLQGIIQAIVDKEFGSGPKTKVYRTTQSINCACPVCGDSSKNVYAKRFHLYLDSLRCYCFNCQYTAMLDSVMKRFKINEDFKLTSEIKTIIKSNKAAAKTKKSFNIDSTSIYPYIIQVLDSIAIDRDKIKKKYGFVELKDASDEIINYIAKRQLPKESWADILYDPISRRLILANTSKDRRKFYSFVSRSLDKNSKKRYLATPLMKIYQDFGMVPEEEYSSIPFTTLNDFANVQNIASLDFNKNIYIVEGGFDSYFIPNGIAVGGLSRVHNIISQLPNVRYILDNDAPGMKSAIGLIRENMPVFLWGKFFRESNITNNHIKDINDIKLAYPSMDIGSIITKNDELFSKSKLDVVYL